MTNGYMKVVGVSEIVARHGNDGESVAATGYLRWQQLFFFDRLNLDSIRAAYVGVERVLATRGGKASVYGQPFRGLSGPWSDLPLIGEEDWKRKAS